MKKQPVTVCPLCEVECLGEGVLIYPINGEFMAVAVRQCPECKMLVPMSDYRYLDAKQRKLLAKINGESEERTA